MDTLLENLLIIDYLETQQVKPQLKNSPIKKTITGEYEATLYFSELENKAPIILTSNQYEHLFEDGFFSIALSL